MGGLVTAFSEGRDLTKLLCSGQPDLVPQANKDRPQHIRLSEGNRAREDVACYRHAPVHVEHNARLEHTSGREQYPMPRLFVFCQVLMWCYYPHFHATFVAE